ncbi:MAG: fasciclin domain-containing protein [Prevotella sp.]|nr:fasciclin domain-containing protein [Prevotella sp.]MBR6188944.1 fasciclin domain-containing protein [Prevotella sp.]
MLGLSFIIYHLSFSVALTSCSEKDELMDQPSWLGNSIYERLQEDGNYKYTLRLIDDLGQKEVLSRTGSKTVFVASDDTYEQFFRQNTWGVHKYDDLTSAQKKLLFNSAMVNNAYLVELLSNVSGNPPLQGQCMRRETAASVFDSVARCYPDEMPNTEFWARYKQKKEGIVLLRDNTSKPMIHFLPKFMRRNNITDEDLSILTNGVSTSAAESWVNGKKLTETDITCKNGYIQKVDGLATAADNMAEIIHNHANMSLFASLLDRFCAPYYDDAATKEYNRLYDNEDSVFTLKYFSSTSNVGQYGASQGGELLNDPDGKAVDAHLGFDPGWSQYMYANTSGRDLHYDAGALLVPKNEALEYWWNHDGKALQDMYHAWENVPMKVLVKMLDLNLIRTFTETVPSKFKNIVDNTTKVPIGITREHVDSCFMGCNGVVYLLNRVFTPASYSSVSFPALINEQTMNVIYWAIETLDFEPYLNSMDSYYSFIIPTNTAMLRYVDPCTYGSSTSILYEFYYDNDRKAVRARRYNYDLATHEIIDDGKELNDATDSQVENRLRDMLDNLIIVGNIEDGHTYYRTKGGSVIKVGTSPEGMTVSGGLQIEEDLPVSVTTIYDQTTNGNGKSYVVEETMPMGSRRSLYSILNGRENCTRFFDLLLNGGTANTLLKARMSSYTCADYNCSLFDAYNYTVYVPTDSEMEKLHNDGLLPDWTDYENLTAEQFGGDASLLKKAQTIVANRILNFLKYHIQDNSVFIGGEPTVNVKYETSTLNPLNNRFFSLTVNADDDKLTIVDQLGNERKVVKGDNYNLIGREYWIQNAQNVNNTQLYNASDVVVHQIDGPLFYQEAQLTKWQEEVEALMPDNE